MKDIDEIYIIKIALVDSKPKIWRRVEVPSNFTFAQLHQIIQIVMPWDNSHLHQFMVKTKNPLTKKSGQEIIISIPEDGFDAEPEDEILLHQYLPNTKSIVYEYDFGDSWEHEIKPEKVVNPENDVLYPRCTEGEMACPPEDCGGIYGYYEMLDTINGKNCERKDELLEWLGDRF